MECASRSDIPEEKRKERNMYQQITIIGNLGRDPVSKQSQSGKQYALCSVATSRSVGQGGKETTWFSVTAWEKTGQYLCNYGQKGSLVMITGRLNPDQNGQPRIWFDNQGNPRTAFEITAQEVKILNGFKSEDQRNQTPQYQTQPRQQYPQQEQEEYY